MQIYTYTSLQQTLLMYTKQMSITEWWNWFVLYQQQLGTLAQKHTLPLKEQVEPGEDSDPTNHIFFYYFRVMNALFIGR